MDSVKRFPADSFSWIEKIWATWSQFTLDFALIFKFKSSGTTVHYKVLLLVWLCRVLTDSAVHATRTAESFIPSSFFRIPIALQNTQA